MSEKTRRWVFAGFYAANVTAVFCLIAFLDLGVSVNFALSFYLVILTALVSYSLANPKNRKKKK